MIEHPLVGQVAVEVQHPLRQRTQGDIRLHQPPRFQVMLQQQAGRQVRLKGQRQLLGNPLGIDQGIVLRLLIQPRLDLPDDLQRIPADVADRLHPVDGVLDPVLRQIGEYVDHDIARLAEQAPVMQGFAVRTDDLTLLTEISLEEKLGGGQRQLRQQNGFDAHARQLISEHSTSR